MRHSYLLIAAACLLLGATTAQAQTALARDGVPATDPEVAASLPRYLQSRSAHFVDWLGDDSVLILTRFGDTPQIHRLHVALGMREQATFVPSGIITAAARPRVSNAFVYLTRRADGNTQLFLQQLDPATVRPLTDGADQDGAATWAPDGRQIAFASNRRNGIDTEVYLLDVSPPAAILSAAASSAAVPAAAALPLTPRLLVGSDGYRWLVYDWSADGSRLLLGRQHSVDSGTAAELYIADVASGSIVPVAGPTAQRTSAPQRRHRQAGTAADAAASLPARVTTARFARDGRGIVVLTRATALGAQGQEAALGRQFLHLMYADPADGQWRELSAAVPHDVERFAQSADGRYLAYTLNEDGQSRLLLIDQQLQLDLAVATPPGIISAMKFDSGGKRLALTLESTRSPPDVYVFDTNAHALTRWTESEVGPLDTRAFVDPLLPHFPTWDRVGAQVRQLSALVYGPAATAGGPRPVVIWLCGGGGAQCRPRYLPFVQYLVQVLGFVVIAPNVRGSSGFGSDLQAAGEGALRDDAVRDIGSLLVWIGLQPALDRERVALVGEGYGSYLALASLAQYGDRLKGAVAAFPSRLSAIPNVLAIRRPVLLVQGLDSTAVPAYQLSQLREGLRSEGVAVQYLTAAGARSEFSRKSEHDSYCSTAASFLLRVLRQ